MGEHDANVRHLARDNGQFILADWLTRIHVGSWKRHLSEPRYALVILRAMAAAKGRARRERAFDGKELALLDFLFPAAPEPADDNTGAEPVDDNTARDQSPPRANKQATRGRPRLPDDVFTIIARFYWGGGLRPEEEAAAAAQAAAPAKYQ